MELKPTKTWSRRARGCPALLGAAFLGAWVLTGCGADAGAGGLSKSAGDSAADAGAAGPGGEWGGAADDAGMAPEDETERLAFSPPAVGTDHVWVVSPDNDLLLRIDARTRAVDPIPVGDAPSKVVTVPGKERGVVLNRGSDELSLVDVGADGVSDVTFVALPRHFNALTLDPSGTHAVLWFDLETAVSGEDATALQDAAVVDLTNFAAPKLHALATGFRPRAPFFSTDGKTCFLVTEDGLTVVDLNAVGENSGAVPRLLPTATDAFHQDGREVAIAPDGTYVVSRGAGETGITILTPADEQLRYIELGAEPTDLDLFADGSRALVMLRDAKQAAFVNLSDGQVDRVPLTAPLGSAVVSPQGDKALLYTTLPMANLEPRIAILDLRTNPPTMTERPVRKEIAGAVIAPGGGAAFLLHRKSDGEPDPTLPPDELLARSHGFSLVDLASGFVRLVTTPAEPTGVLFSADLARAWVPLGDANRDVRALMVADLSGLSVRNVELPSVPEVVGEVPAADRIFVTQTHPEGRISFLARDAAGAENDALETLSGYLLNGRIE